VLAAQIPIQAPQIVNVVDDIGGLDQSVWTNRRDVFLELTVQLFGCPWELGTMASLFAGFIGRAARVAGLEQHL